MFPFNKDYGYAVTIPDHVGVTGIEMVAEASNGEWTLRVFAAGDMVLLEFESEQGSFSQGGSVQGGEADWFDGHYAYGMREDGSWWATFR